MRYIEWRKINSLPSYESKQIWEAADILRNFIEKEFGILHTLELRDILTIAEGIPNENQKINLSMDIVSNFLLAIHDL